MANPKIKLPPVESFEPAGSPTPFPAPPAAANGLSDELEAALTTNIDVLTAALRRSASAQLSGAQPAHPRPADRRPTAAEAAEGVDEEDDLDDLDDVGDVDESPISPTTEERTLETEHQRPRGATRRLDYAKRVRGKAAAPPLESRLADAHARGAGRPDAIAAASARWEAAAKVDLTNVAPVKDQDEAEPEPARARPARQAIGAGMRRRADRAAAAGETAYDENHVSDTLAPTLRGWSLEDDLVAVAPVRYARRRRSPLGMIAVAAVLLASAGGGAMVALRWLTPSEPVVTAAATPARTVSAAAAVERAPAPVAAPAAAAAPAPAIAAAAAPIAIPDAARPASQAFDVKPAIPAPAARSAAVGAAAPAVDRRDVVAAPPKAIEDEQRRPEPPRTAAPAPSPEPPRQTAALQRPEAPAPAPLVAPPAPLVAPAVRAAPPAAARPAEPATDHPAWFTEDDPHAFEPPVRRGAAGATAGAAAPGASPAAPQPNWFAENDPTYTAPGARPPIAAGNPPPRHPPMPRLNRSRPTARS